MTGAISHVRTPDWLALQIMAPEPASEALGSILVSLDQIEEKAFAVRGEAMFMIEERNLFRFFIDPEVDQPYESLDRWLKDTLPRSWGYCRDALRARKECRDIPYTDFSQIKRCNLEQLKKTSSNVRVLPEVIQAAKSMPEKQFVAKLNSEHSQHLDVKQPVVMVESEVHLKLDEAIEIATLLYGCKSRGEALECIAQDFVDSHAIEFEHERAG